MIGYVILSGLILLMIGVVAIQVTFLKDKAVFIEELLTEITKYEMNLMVLKEAQYGKKMRAKERDGYLEKIEEATTDEEVDILFAELVARNNNRV